MNISLVGNCQMATLGRCMAIMLPGANIKVGSPTDIKSGRITVQEAIGAPEILLIQSVVKGEMRAEMEAAAGRVVRLPMLAFGGFHPDIVHAHCNGEGMRMAGSSEHSAIILYSVAKGLQAAEIVSLFRGDVFRALGYLDGWDHHVSEFLARPSDINLSHLMQSRDCFMHSLSHPKLAFVADVARAICDQLGLSPAVRFPERVMVDMLTQGLVLPVYPEIATSLGLEGEYAFKMPDNSKNLGHAPVLGLAAFVDQCLADYAGLDGSRIVCPRFDAGSSWETMDRVLDGSIFAHYEPDFDFA